MTFALILWCTTICTRSYALPGARVHPAATPALSSASSPVHSQAAPVPSLSEPAAAAKAFDSLLLAGKVEEARRLCTGQVLRMFDLIVMAQAKMGEAIDTTRSTDTTLEEKTEGAWAFLKVSSLVVFKQPLLGQDSIRSVQAVHLFRQGQRWLVAEMEELEGPATLVHIRTGLPTDPQSSGEASLTPPSTNLFPVSKKAPVDPGKVDRLQFRLSLKNGGLLAPLCALGPEQRLVRTESNSQWILENCLSKLDRTNRAEGINKPVLSDSLRPYLVSNGFLALEDSLLLATASRIAGRESDPTRITENIYTWITANFEFELGAVLFGTSSEVLRGMKGDCSEAAILTAALLRACGIPSRLALGFASVGRGVFIGHAWTEAYLGNQWVGVDAALRQFPAGVERVKLATLDGKADMRVVATNLMMSVLSNLDIELLSAWKNGKLVPLEQFSDNSAEGLQFFEKILKGFDKP